MKIALVQPKMDRSGGAERYALGLARELAVRGHRVDVFARKTAGLPGGVRFHRVPSVPLGRALKTYSFWRRCERLVHPEQFDVVQGAGKTTCQTVHRAGGGVHRAYLERSGQSGLGLYDRVVLGIEDRLFASPALRCVVVPSKWVEAEVSRFYPGVAPRIRRIPNGVDVAMFEPSNRARDRVRVLEEVSLPLDASVLLFVATNFALKGLETAVKALARLTNSHLLVVGKDHTQPFRDLAMALGVGERVHFMGSRTEIDLFYRAADVLVHPTHYDTFGNVIFEAMACGTPAVVSDRAGAAEVLGMGGQVVAYPCDPAEIASAVKNCLAAGDEGRRRARAVAQEHSSGRHADRMEALYRELQGEIHP